jgi:hypothetical protein
LTCQQFNREIFEIHFGISSNASRFPVGNILVDNAEFHVATSDFHHLKTFQYVLNEGTQRYTLCSQLIDNVELRNIERSHGARCQAGVAIAVHNINNIKPLPMRGNISAQQFLRFKIIQTIRQQLTDIELPLEL